MFLQVGVTGGIGSGKSLVCRIFNILGVSVYDADSRAKKVMTTDGILVSGIKKEFGVLSYNPEGNLNRKYLSETVFHDPEKLARLNQLVHPRVAEDYRQWARDKSGKCYVIKEAALLFEAYSHLSLDKIIVVHAPERIRIKRVLKRDRERTENQVKEIMARQMPEEEKLKRADFVIWNDDTKLVIPQVLQIHEQLKSECAK